MRDLRAPTFYLDAEDTEVDGYVEVKANNIDQEYEEVGGSEVLNIYDLYPGFRVYEAIMGSMVSYRKKPEKIKKYNEAAGANYMPKNDQELTDLGYKIHNISTKGDDEAAVVLVKNDAVVVAYHGTKNSEDYCTDLSVALSNDGTIGKVHSGFLKWFDGSAKQVYDILNQSIAENPNRQIVFTGHSMGGAVATIAAIHASKKLSPEVAGNIQLITFGSPRVITNATYEEHFKGSALQANTLRFVVNGDPIPAMPPGNSTAILANATTGSSNNYYKHAGERSLIPSPDANTTYAALRRLFENATSMPLNLANHSMKAYLQSSSLIASMPSINLDVFDEGLKSTSINLPLLRGTGVSSGSGLEGLEDSSKSNINYPKVLPSIIPGFLGTKEGGRAQSVDVKKSR